MKLNCCFSVSISTLSAFPSALTSTPKKVGKCGNCHPKVLILLKRSKIRRFYRKFVAESTFDNMEILAEAASSSGSLLEERVGSPQTHQSHILHTSATSGIPGKPDDAEMIRRELSASNLLSLSVQDTRNRSNSGHAPSPSQVAPPQVPLMKKSKSFSYNQGQGDWRKNLSVEDRQKMREKIRETLRSNVVSFETLLEICSDFEEDMLYKLSPSRLDYFRTGSEFKNKICKKINVSRTKGNKSPTSPSGSRKRSESSDDMDMGLAAVDHEGGVKKYSRHSLDTTDPANMVRSL